MNKRHLAIFLGATASLLALAAVLADDEREHHGSGDRTLVPLAAQQQDLYQRECGGCHLAYPPALLPAASWTALMGRLADHFGDSADLDPATAQRITALLVEHAADGAPGGYAARIRRSTLGQPPALRITATDYFLGKHHEIPANMVRGNPGVSSFSRCEACHRRAALGSFDEDEVRIPGYGRFDD